MRARAACRLAKLAGLSVVIGIAAPAFAGGNNGTVCPTPVGPDVIVGDIVSPAANYAAQSLSGVFYDAFSFGTTSCNVGNMTVQWNDFPAATHPAIGQSMYKLKDGRIEQIGVSWLKHGFLALTGNVCGCGCTNPGTGALLGIGCSDPYTASRNGSQGGLGPRWQVNADTGVFPTGGPANPPFSGSVARRLRVRSTDLEPSSASVLFFAECQYVTQDDANWSNQNNNASYRQISLTGGPNEFTAAMLSSTQRAKPAIRAWKVAHPDVVETNIQLANEGLFILAARATDLGGGMWHYEYALHNLNSDRSGRGFTVPLPDGLALSNIGFHDIEYHSGDAGGNFSNGSLNFSGTDWAVTQASNSINWATELFAVNSNANALRWGTMYNFRFDAPAPPQTGNATLETFRLVASVNASTLVPGVDCNLNNIADSIDISGGASQDVNLNGIPDECEGEPCSEDINGDNQVNVDDLLAVINGWGGAGKADINGDGIVNVDDLLAVINAWGGC